MATMALSWVFISLVLTFVHVSVSNGDCPDLEVRRGAEVTCRNSDGFVVSCEGEGVPEGTLARFSCRPHYVRSEGISGSIQRACQSDGSWSGTSGFACEPDCGRMMDEGVISTDGSNAGRRRRREGRVPWNARIFRRQQATEENDSNDDEFQCFGTLYDESRIVTAAHCVTEPNSSVIINPDEFQVVLGDYYLIDSNAQARRVTQISVHPNYNPDARTNDVASLYLDTPADINDDVNIICVLGKHRHDDEVDFQEGSEGWVTTSVTSAGTVLYSVTYVPDDKCTAKITDDDVRDRYFDPVSPGRYCAAFDTCPSTPAEVGENDFCPDGWIALEDNCYHVSHDKATWDDARAKCQAYPRGELASLHSETEMQHVIKNMRRYLWIGLNSLEEQNEWVWSDGSPFSYEVWGENEPDNTDTDRCIELVHMYNANEEDSGAFHTRRCSVRRNFACHLHDQGGTSSCPNNWEREGQYCYYVSESMLTWTEARDYCKSVDERADLASVHSDEELKILVDKMMLTAWIGFNSLDDQNVYEWSDGSQVDFTKWARNEPNFLEVERCTELRHQPRYGQLGGDWNNLPCARELQYACKVPKNPIFWSRNSDESFVYQGTGIPIMYEGETSCGKRWYLEGVTSSVYVERKPDCYKEVHVAAKIDDYENVLYAN